MRLRGKLLIGVALTLAAWPFLSTIFAHNTTPLWATSFHKQEAGIWPGEQSRPGEQRRLDLPLKPQRSVVSLVRSLEPFTANESARARATPDLLRDCLKGACNWNTTGEAISVVMAYKDAANWTQLSTLSVLLALKDRQGSELVLVNDGSRDEQRREVDQMLLLHKGATKVVHVSLRSSVGYTKAVNVGLRSRRLKGAVLLMNNDVLLWPSTLDLLCETLRMHSRAGAVAARLLGLDGALQEAGAVVFSDAGAAQLSALWTGHDLLARHTRPVDYGSAACLLLRRGRLLDERYAPAYYEDTDLAMALRQMGESVLYQPFAVAVHAGSQTYRKHGSLLQDSGVKFARKWDLSCNYDRDLVWYPRSPFLLATRLSALRVLYIESQVPCVDRDSGSVRTSNFLRLFLSRRFHVTFAVDHMSATDPCVYELELAGVRVVPTSELELTSLIGCDFDLVFLARRDIMLSWSPIITELCPRAALVFDTVDLAFVREFRSLSLDHGMTYNATLTFSANVQRLVRFHGTLNQTFFNAKFGTWFAAAIEEKELFKQTDASIVVSATEADIVKSLPSINNQTAASIFQVSNIHDIPPASSSTASFESRKGAIFVGNWAHAPNVDAVRVLVEEVLLSPELDKMPQDFVMHIAGAGAAPSWMKNLTKAGRFRVVFHGEVPLLEPLLRSIRVSVAPLRYGAGVKGKVNQAMIQGLPVVATPMATEGMFLQPEIDVLVGENSDDFARQLLRLYTNKALWEFVVENALMSVRRVFSLETAQDRFDEILAYLFIEKPWLRQSYEEGSKVLTGDGKCSILGKMGLGAGMDGIPTSEKHEYVRAALKPWRVLVAENDRAPLELWHVSNVTARHRCDVTAGCAAYCHNPTDKTFLYLAKVVAQRKRGKYPPGWDCFLKGAQKKVIPEEGRIDLVRLGAVKERSNRIFAHVPELHVAWSVSAAVAALYCHRRADCSGYCHHPGDYSFFYKVQLVRAMIIDRGLPGQYPPGWACAARKHLSERLQWLPVHKTHRRAANATLNSTTIELNRSSSSTTHSTTIELNRSSSTLAALPASSSDAASERRRPPPPLLYRRR